MRFPSIQYNKHDPFLFHSRCQLHLYHPHHKSVDVPPYHYCVLTIEDVMLISGSGSPSLV